MGLWLGLVALILVLVVVLALPRGTAPESDAGKSPVTRPTRPPGDGGPPGADPEVGVPPSSAAGGTGGVQDPGAARPMPPGGGDAASPDLPPGHPDVTPAGNEAEQVTIQWLGHATFYIHTPGGIAVVADPYDPRTTGLPRVETGAHLVTVSSTAPDHSYTAAVHAFEGEARRVLTGQGARLKDLTITAVPLGEGRTAYVYVAAGLRIAHLGDLRAPLTPAQARALGSVDILMVPAGGGGITPRQAVDAAKLVQPRVVLPMTYAASGMTGDRGLRPVDDFIAASPYAVTQKDQDVILISRAELPTDTEIFLLKPPRQ